MSLIVYLDFDCSLLQQYSYFINTCFKYSRLKNSSEKRLFEKVRMVILEETIHSTFCPKKPFFIVYLHKKV